MAVGGSGAIAGAVLYWKWFANPGLHKFRNMDSQCVVAFHAGNGCDDCTEKVERMDMDLENQKAILDRICLNVVLCAMPVAFMLRQDKDRLIISTIVATILLISANFVSSRIFFRIALYFGVLVAGISSEMFNIVECLWIVGFYELARIDPKHKRKRSKGFRKQSENDKVWTCNPTTGLPMVVGSGYDVGGNMAYIKRTSNRDSKG